MNQIPNIEETHNTREIEEIKNIIADEVLTRDGQVYLSSTGEERLKQTHHQQLQKARQAIADVLCAKLEGVQTYGHEYLISKEEVKKIIKQTLSNK